MNLPTFVDHYIARSRAGLDQDSEAPDDVLQWLNDHKSDHQLLDELAREQQLPYGITKWLADHDNVDVRKRLAANVTIDPVVLAQLAHAEQNEEIRKAVAQNHGASSETLRQLAEDGSPHVRMGVAGNPSVPKDVLAGLRDDHHDVVSGEARRAFPYWDVFAGSVEEQLATLEATDDIDVLERYFLSPHASVRKAVMTHTATPAALVKELVLADPDEPVQIYGARWEQVRPLLLRELAEDDQQPDGVRIAAMHNQRMPKASLQRLIKHTNPFIAGEARKALAARQ